MIVKGTKKPGNYPWHYHNYLIIKSVFLLVKYMEYCL